MGFNQLKVSLRNRAYIYLFPYLQANYGTETYEQLNKIKVENAYFAILDKEEPYKQIDDKTKEYNIEISLPYIWVEYNKEDVTEELNDCLTNHPCFDIKRTIKKFPDKVYYKMRIDDTESYTNLLQGNYSLMFKDFIRKKRNLLNGTFHGNRSFSLAFLVWTKHWIRKAFMDKFINKDCGDRERIEITDDMELDSKPIPEDEVIVLN